MMFFESIFILIGPRNVVTIVSEIMAVTRAVSNSGSPSTSVTAPICAIASGVES